MPNNIGKAFSPIPVFDPTAGTVIRSPLGSGRGWWAGAPCATFDSITNTFFLVYRLRQPRELGRGVECRIAASDNGGISLPNTPAAMEAKAAVAILADTFAAFASPRTTTGDFLPEARSLRECRKW